MKVAHDADFSKKDALENYSSVAKQALTKLNPTDGHDPVSQWALTDALLGKKPDIAFIPFDGKPTPKLGGALYNNTKPLDKVVAVGPVLVPQELSNGVLTKNTDITTYFKKLGELDPAPKRVIIPIALQPGGGKVNHMVIAVKEGDKVTIFDPLGQTSSYKDQFTPFLSEAGIKPENIQWGKHKTVETNGLHCGDWGAWFTESIASDLSIPMTEEGINTAITSKLGTDGYDTVSTVK